MLPARRAFLATLTAGMFSVSAWAQNPCDLTHDGAVDFADVNLAVNMALGLAPCATDLQGSGGCNVVTVQRVINAAMGGTCTPTGAHSVTLTWVGSISANVAGYNVYRAPALDGVYTKLNSTLVHGVSYIDSAVQAGQTYYYIATAVDDTNRESAYSKEAQAAIPSP